MTELITPFLATSAGGASRDTKRDMVKAAIRPYSDVKYCVGPRSRCHLPSSKRSLLNVGHVNARARSKLGRKRPSILEVRGVMLLDTFPIGREEKKKQKEAT
jgi:hypothetical protein